MRQLRAEHHRGDIAGDVLRGEADALEDVAARAVVEELVGQAELGDGGVDARLAQVLADARADAADADAVFDAHDDAVLARRAR